MKWMRHSTSGTSRVVYHTDKDCRMLKREPIEASERDIDVMGLRECKICAGDADHTAGNGNREYYNLACSHE